MDSSKSNGESNGNTNRSAVGNGNVCDIENSIPEFNELCFFCRQKATQRCSHCNISYHCCDEHGLIHRPDDVCFPFCIEYLPEVGNYMVASRDIEPAGLNICMFYDFILLLLPRMLFIESQLSWIFLFYYQN